MRLVVFDDHFDSNTLFANFNISLESSNLSLEVPVLKDFLDSKAQESVSIVNFGRAVHHIPDEREACIMAAC